MTQPGEGSVDLLEPATLSSLRLHRLPMYLADTSALLRLHVPAVAARLNPLILQGTVGRCGPIDLEMLRTAQSSAEFRVMRTAREQAFPLLHLDQTEVNAAIDLQQALEDNHLHRGAKLPDLLIAAVAIRHNVTVLHYDSDYDNIAQVSKLQAEWVAPRGSIT